MKADNTILRYFGWLAGLLLLACLPACMIELDGGRTIDSPLMVLPSVSGSQLTKATVPAVSAQKEDTLINLDVFVKGVTVPAFWKSYHLKVDPDNLQAEVDNLLSRNWREDVDDSGTRNYVEGDKYDVYAVANSDLTASVASFDALKALKENEFSDDPNTGCVWSDGTINPERLNLHKTYKSDFDSASASGQNRRAFTNHKKFVMDGVVRNWSPVGGMQVIPMTLERAACKFEANVTFSNQFLAVLASEGKRITGMPGWRFVNFAYDAPLINPEHYDGGTVTDAEHVLTAGALLLGNASFDPDNNYSFTISTYSYPHKWDLADAVNEAPALVLSVGYQEIQTGNTRYTYYRIPLVDQKTVTSVGRNMFYRVNASIEAAGSTSLDDLTGMVLEYEVIPWNDPQHSGTQPAPVEYNERLYLQVTPHTYVLRGDGEQTVDLTYTLPTSKHVKIQYFTTQQNNERIMNGEGVANVGSTYQNGYPAAWYYNKSGSYRTTFVGSNVQVSITDNNPTDEISKGTITVKSNSLANKAIKHIAFRVYLDVPNWYTLGLYRDIYIRHFPTDNIQGIPGSWSSRWNSGYTTQTVREYSFNPEADGWGDPSDFSFENNIECSLSDYNRALEKQGTSSGTAPIGTPSDNDSASTTENGGNNSTMQTNFRNAVPQDDRQGANSEANAYKDPNSDYWYWGTNPSTTNSTSNYDYTSRYRYRYQTYYRRIYYKNVTIYKARRYYRDVTKPVASTGNWVDWDRDANQTYNQSTAKYTYDGSNFQAKVYDETAGKVYPINVSNNYKYTVYTDQTGGQYCYSEASNSRVQSNTTMTSLNNNYMYVIQISETNPTYKLGRPELDQYYQTNDHVVSPAFMIASQLGAVSSFGNTQEGGRNAAAHCNSYMEVATNGTRYVGWRLPTAEEIAVIIKYQGTTANSVTIDGVTINDTNDRVLTPVLTGSHYWTSNNKTAPVATGYSTTGTNYAVRCIRDMSAEEIKTLNRD